MGATLTLISDPEGDRRFSLETPRVVLGTGPDADVVVPDEDSAGGGVAPRHAAVEFEDGSWAVVHLGGSRGTFLNGRKIGERHVLRDGDEIQLGLGGPRLRLAVDVTRPDPPNPAAHAPSADVERGTAPEPGPEAPASDWAAVPTPSHGGRDRRRVLAVAAGTYLLGILTGILLTGLGFGAWEDLWHRIPTGREDRPALPQSEEPDLPDEEDRSPPTDPAPMPPDPAPVIDGEEIPEGEDEPVEGG